MGRTGPYREGRTRGESTPADGGIVDDLVQQFADPLAFYRELIQNAIDAETDRVIVSIQHSPGEPVVISVQDRGEGMDQETLQEKLLVLFRSGKENQEGKIGKFGVGFVSVLAMEPERVTVRTSRGQGKTHVLHLYRDHSYELFEAGGGRRPGTTVSLAIHLEEERLGDFIVRSREALTRWCRFAQTPIELRVVRGGEVTATHRIDRELAFEKAEVQVTHVEDGTKVVVALAEFDGPYAGFFNQGLLLHEARGSMGGVLDGVRFIVQDARLEHTLSRDDVRRDGAYRRALRLVTRVASKQLVAAATARLAEHAESSSASHARLLARLVAAMRSLPIDARDLTLQRIKPLLGRRGVRVDEAGDRLVLADDLGSLTDLLIAREWVVVRATTQGALERAEVPFRHATKDFTRIDPVETSPADEALLGALGELLEASERRPAAVALVTLTGRNAGQRFLAGYPRTEPVLHEGPAKGDPFRILGRAGLLLDVADDTVREARALAETDPQVAAALLARDILLAFDRLDSGTDENLTEAALTEVLEVGP